ncbi:F-box/LRR-repeat protein At3g26922-like [Bidens hawaiensis]|uniref:F-box/LRR-repeat protein At3g26922-like n=1 Tax=Bidens hawaiensis TaxID=980011 RepID=UPI0040497DD7
MAVKRLCKQQPETQMKPLKRLRLEGEEQQPNAAMADRLSTLPEDMRLRILSSLDTKLAFETSLLSKAWSSKWTHVPVLDFNSSSFSNRVCAFDKFFYGVLSVPRSAPLVRINFRRLEKCSAKILKKVFDYAFKQGVEELDVSIEETRKQTGWPMIMSRTASWDSLKSLKLQSYKENIRCSYLGPRSGYFKNLASLHLRKAVITDLDPFSGFPALKKLKLVFCELETDDYALNIHAPHLTELTIAYHYQCVNRCNLTTPNLKYFEFRGGNFPRFETTGGLIPGLDTVLQKTGREETSLTVCSSVVHILSLFPDELATRCSLFWDLKSLRVDLSLFYEQRLFEGTRRSWSEALIHVSRVKGYLLQKSPDVKCTIIDPDDPEAQHRCSNTHEYNRGRSIQYFILVEVLNLSYCYYLCYVIAIRLLKEIA